MSSKKEFVETKLQTAFGEFLFRVYAGPPGKETIVIYTQKLESTSLVRVHSECITSEVFKSCHCDCREQLEHALKIIQQKTGAIIYLRQEGRSIGLFEKIKAYNLQDQGLDTFQANIELGHLPDQRSYEIVGTILNDLNIKTVRLLTNNPSKVSALVELGVDIQEIVPIIIKPNPYNEKYINTKVQKFQHFSKNFVNKYFYQFHLSDHGFVDSITAFIRKQRRDPLVEIYVGINSHISKLNQSTEIERINEIINKCIQTQLLIPVLHLSFSNERFSEGFIKNLKSEFLNLHHLQLNDIDKIDISLIEKISSQYILTLPLDDNNFKSLSNPIFIEIIQKNGITIALDNSKGRGQVESYDIRKEKIQYLLDKGINKIAIYGGFGSRDSLHDYFDLKNYYRCNFSIDAQTKLKINGKYSEKKILNYLSSLINSSSKNNEGIKQTEAYLNKGRRSSWESLEIENSIILIHPKVFHPGHFPSSVWFLKILQAYLKNKKNIGFCEVGCGSGIISCLLAKANQNLNITATDINPDATYNTQVNSQRLKIEDRLKVFNGNVLEGIPDDYLFDYIFWALPFGFVSADEELSYEGMQVFDSGYKAIKQFFESAKTYLKPKGKLLLGYSSDLGNNMLLHELAKHAGLKLKVLKKTYLKEEKKLRFELILGEYQS